MTHAEIVIPGAPGGQEWPNPSQRILHSIRRITRAVDLYSKKLVLDFGITAPQLMVLDEIVAKGAMMVRSVAAEIHLSASTLVGIVDRLEAKGLAHRERTAPDRRKVLVVPTEAGRSLVARAPSALQGTLAEALKHLPHAEQMTIAMSLEKVVDLMEIGKWEAEGPVAGGEVAVPLGGEILRTSEEQT